MAINLIPVKCPACGANLNIEEGRKQIFCSYCGMKIIVNNENEYIYRHIDEAQIKQTEAQMMQTEAETLLRIKELEIEEKDKERNRKKTRIAYTVAVLFAIIGIFILLFNNPAGLFAVLAGASIATVTHIGNENREKRKTKKTLSPNDAIITDKIADYENKNYNSIAELFKAAGFTNVNTVALRDLNLLNAMSKGGKVEDVSIDGDSDFEEGDVFAKSANIIITYHST